MCFYCEMARLVAYFRICLYMVDSTNVSLVWASQARPNKLTFLIVIQNSLSSEHFGMCSKHSTCLANFLTKITSTLTKDKTNTIFSCHLTINEYTCKEIKPSTAIC